MKEEKHFCLVCQTTWKSHREQHSPTATRTEKQEPY